MVYDLRMSAKFIDIMENYCGEERLFKYFASLVLYVD